MLREKKEREMDKYSGQHPPQDYVNAFTTQGGGAEVDTVRHSAWRERCGWEEGEKGGGMDRGGAEEKGERHGQGRG